MLKNDHIYRSVRSHEIETNGRHTRKNIKKYVCKKILEQKQTLREEIETFGK